MGISRAKKRSREHLIFRWKIILKFILFLLFISVFFVAANKLKQAQYFPIKEVKVYGVHNADRDAMQTVISPLVKDGFFGVDVDLIKERVQQSPWVNRVFVQRVWPEQVLITLEERDPIARWNKNSLLSESGELFTPDRSSYPENLPEFIGPEGQQIQMLQYFKKMNSLVMPLHLKILRLELLSSQAWNLTFDNGVKLSVGHKDVLTHIGHFVKVYPKIVGNRASDVDYVDLRYPNGLAVRWKTIS
jgi:cell division protein FtsQ